MKNLELATVSRRIPRDGYRYVANIAFVDDLTSYMLRELELLVCDKGGNIIHTDYSFPFECITEFEILHAERKLWFGTGTHFVHVDLTDNNVQIIEPPCSFEAAVWNPEQDSIAVITSSGELGVYTVDFEEGFLLPVQETHLDNILMNEFVNVNVGWGSCDTQFQGKAGKPSLATTDEIKPALVFDDETPKISWRGNGQMFAVNCFVDGKRRIKIYRYPCELISESPDIVGLQPLIAWRPQGNRIACVVQTEKKCKVILLESNGLVRDSFRLRKVTRVHDLKWSHCSEVLAVCQSFNTKCTIDLYIQKNYRWYMKQSLEFPDNLIHFEFVSSPTTLVVLRVTNVTETVTYSFKYAIHVSSCWDDRSMSCAVINGSKVYMTFCRKGITPPPLFDAEAEVDAPVNFLAFHPIKPKLAVIDAANTLSVYDIKDQQLVLVGRFQYHTVDMPLMLHRFIWCNTEKIICLLEGQDAEGSTVDKGILNVQDADCSKWFFYIEKGPIVQRLFNEITVNGDEEHLQLMELVPASALYIKLATVDEKRYIFSLTSTGVFLINGTEVLQGVVSFIIHDRYLVLTTSQNNVMAVRLNESSLQDLLQLNFGNVHTRPVEARCYLCFGIPQTSSVIMQVPRGNIETCTIQLMSIHRLEELIQQNAWDRAVELVRIEKLATNTLVDLNVHRFLDNINIFVDSVKTQRLISDFLLGLREENVFRTLYPSCGITPLVDVENKREQICDRMIAYMQQTNYVYYICSIITACFVKNAPFTIHIALFHIRSLMMYGETNPISIRVAEEAMKNVNSLKPKVEIYHAALSMYDLDLALFVAKNIEMDPREYEPFIGNLKKLSELMCRHKINDFLREYDQAACYLVRSSADVAMVVAYVEEHEVFKAAYQCVNSEHRLFIPLTKAFGNYLMRQSLFEEAAVVFLGASMFEEVLVNFKKANQWQKAIRIMKRLNLTQIQTHQHLRDLVNGLIRDRRILEASQIYNVHLSDYENAIALLIDHKLFSEAIELAENNDRKDIIESEIYVAILDYCKDLTTKLVDMDASFRKYKDRLNEVRNVKRAKAEASAVPGTYLESTPQLEDDTHSIAGTASTVTTRTTSSRLSSMSSRNRRKEERKKQDLREGGMYEDIALIRVLYDLIHEAFLLGPPVRQLCIIGYEMQLKTIPGDIKLLHMSLVKLQTLMRREIKTIWPPVLDNLNQSEDLHLTTVNENLIYLDVKYRVPPSNLDLAWELTLLDLD